MHRCQRFHFMPLCIERSMHMDGVMRLGGSWRCRAGCRCPAKWSWLTGQRKCHNHTMENVTLTSKEQARLQVLNSLLSEQIALDQAAELMGVSTRHARRMLATYRERGAASLSHGHRGRKPANAASEVVAADGVPRQLNLPNCRQLVLPVHLLCLAPLLSGVSPVAGHVKLQDDGVVHHPVDGGGGGHGVVEDAFPL